MSRSTCWRAAAPVPPTAAATAAAAAAGWCPAPGGGVVLLCSARWRARSRRFRCIVSPVPAVPAGGAGGSGRAPWLLAPAPAPLSASSGDEDASSFPATHQRAVKGRTSDCCIQAVVMVGWSESVAASVSVRGAGERQPCSGGV